MLKTINFKSDKLITGEIIDDYTIEDIFTIYKITCDLLGIDTYVYSCDYEYQNKNLKQELVKIIKTICPSLEILNRDLTDKERKIIISNERIVEFGKRKKKNKK